MSIPGISCHGFDGVVEVVLVLEVVLGGHRLGEGVLDIFVR